MDLFEILSGTSKKDGSDFSEFIREIAPSNAQADTNNGNLIGEEGKMIKTGKPSEIDSEGWILDDDDPNKVVITIEKLINNSPCTTGELKLILWVNEYKYSEEHGWAGPNHGQSSTVILGVSELGHLEEKYYFKNIQRTFDLTDDDTASNTQNRLYYVLTINELHEDGNWYIVDHRNGPCYRLSEVEDQLFQRIVGVYIDEDEFGDEFFTEIHMDQDEYLEMISTFEANFGIKFDEEDVANNINNVRDLYDRLMWKL